MPKIAHENGQKKEKFSRFSGSFFFLHSSEDVSVGFLGKNPKRRLYLEGIYYLDFRQEIAQVIWLWEGG